jgi:hypothetical protein
VLFEYDLADYYDEKFAVFGGSIASSGEISSSSLTPWTSVLANGRTRRFATSPARRAAPRTTITTATVHTITSLTHRWWPVGPELRAPLEQLANRMRNECPGRELIRRNLGSGAAGGAATDRRRATVSISERARYRTLNANGRDS